MPVYSINGISYLPLEKLCRQAEVNWDYDTVSRTATLTKGAHKVELMAGQALILVDGLPQHLKHRVDIYEGQIVVPLKFKEQVIDALFKEAAALPSGVIPPKIRKIIVDAGHGGNDPGAIGRSGIKEKYVNLDIAKRLAKLLRQRGFEVVMTRSADNFVHLRQRVDIANNSGAGLFVSIHSNANRVRSLSGFEAYLVSYGPNDIERAVATAKTEDLNVDRSCFYQETPELKAMLWDIVYTGNRSEAAGLARNICAAADRQLDVKILGTKSAGFQVLKGTHMPAVLVEVGFLSNAKEEALLKNSYYRQQIAEAVAQGIANYAREMVIAEAG